jgi:hypothetical protein
MFKNKKCNVDKNLLECDAVKNIRDYQEQLKKIKHSFNINDILSKYLLQLEDGHILNDNKKNIQLITDLNEYIKKIQLDEELRNKIKEEKNKLGIT